MQAPSRRKNSRRDFLKSTCAVAAGLQAVGPSKTTAAQGAVEQLALLGGPKVVTAPSASAARWPLYGKAEEEAVLALVRRPSYDPIAALEKDWKEKFDARHVRAHCSGTAALAAMFFALDLPPGSEIMVPSYTFFATIVPMRNFGLVPNFVDINPRTLNFDVDDAKKRLTKNTRAVLPVHWMGLPCDMDQICDWAKQKGLIVLEDAAHAHGAKLQGKLAGNWSRMAIFSFQATKPLPALEGGIGVYQEQDDCDRATAYGHYDLCSGKYAKYKGSGLGMKLRMHPMAAALARTQLNALAERNAAGVAQMRRLNDRLTQLPGLYEQQTRKDCERIYYSSNKLFIDEAQAGMSRAACVKALQAEGVRASASSYPLQHKMPLYTEAQWWHHKPEIPDLPGSEQANATAISLPYFTSDQRELVEQYAKSFEKVWAHRQQLAKGS
jgi:dTDP-4-amino-4,6-dideoxygalactose transaminase